MFKFLFMLLCLSFVIPAKAFDIQLYIEFQYKVKSEDAFEIVKQVNHYSKLSGVSPALVFAIIERESSFNHKAKNNKSLGLMQVNTAWKVHRDLFGSSKVTEIASNIKAGVAILSKCKMDKRGVLPCYHGKKSKTYISYINKKVNFYNQGV